MMTLLMRVRTRLTSSLVQYDLSLAVLYQRANDVISQNDLTAARDGWRVNSA